MSKRPREAEEGVKEPAATADGAAAAAAAVVTVAAPTSHSSGADDGAGPGPGGQTTDSGNGIADGGGSGGCGDGGETLGGKRRRTGPEGAGERGHVLDKEKPSSWVDKRQDYICWDDYFMAVAFLSAKRSKDPSTQVGACIVNEDKKIVGIGYNGFPNGISDDDLSWARTADDDLDTKYPYVCHAEMNAIMNKNTESLKRCKIYVALFPCNECSKLIIQSGITEVVYLSDKYHDTPKMVASRRLLDLAGVSYVQHKPAMASMTLEFSTN